MKLLVLCALKHPIEQRGKPQAGAQHNTTQLVTTYQKAELRKVEVWDRRNARHEDIRGGSDVFPSICR